MPATEQPAVYVAIVIAILGFMIGIAKGGFGGLGALLTPILALVLPVTSAVGVLLPMLMVGDVFAVYMYWKEWDLDLVRRMLPAGIVGALAGTFLLSAVSPDGLRIMLRVFERMSRNGCVTSAPLRKIRMIPFCCTKKRRPVPPITRSGSVVAL